MIKRTTALIVTVVLIVIYNQAIAQVNSPAEKGYLVTAAGDTLRGFLHYSNVNVLYKKVGFSPSIDGPKTTYEPASANGFYLEKTNQMFMSGKLLPNTTYKGMFIRVLVAGQIDLLRIPGKSNSSFIVRKGDTIKKLNAGRKETKTIGNYSYQVDKKPYLADLQQLFADCIKDTLTVKYSGPHLSAAVSRYNSCMKSESKTFAESNKSQWTFGFALSAITSTLNFEDKKTVILPYQYPSGAPTGRYDLTELTKATDSYLSIAAGVTATLYPRGLKNWSFMSEFLLSSRKWKGSRVDVNLGYIQVPVSLRYNFLTSKAMQPVLGIGADLAFCYKSKYNKTSYSWDFHRDSPARSGDTFPAIFDVDMPTFLEKEFNPGMVMPFVSAGLEHHGRSAIISASYRYEFSGAITRSPLYRTPVTNQVFTVSASFVRKNKAGS